MPSTLDLTDVPYGLLVGELQRRLECATKPERRVVLLGPPGCGKGTQSPALKRDFCLCHLATGDMLRAAVGAGTPNGLRAKAAMESGALVTDDIVIGIIEEATKKPECRNGFILDGFPRNVTQAQALDQMLASKGVAIDKVLNFEVPDSLLVERVTGRLVHPASGRSYHEKFAPPKVSMTDDVTGEPLIRRKDDNADTLKARLSTFHSQTAPVIDYYKKQGALVNIKADNPFDKVKTAIFGALNK
ncbi:hypothetical protein PPROV_001044800 [Pycnococcus provasolii]|uniref:adenylate kinase n=2 Tax=Pycnococcus provasolii TaxID=41880 RepID=A0A830I1T4_9CHLO|nr:hypothetical protein PPROV_001044800 [Pycnococcus provasolii]|mmetsp:Transcript_9269/g.24967  ORF Transcript_9269/g.24967 Transcript_9269/m.24967 type:complete len:245 (+) Transcript_9269:1-735(+)